MSYDPYVKPLYAHLARAIQARLNCKERKERTPEQDNGWFGEWEDRINDLVKEYLPSGSGIDCGTKIDLDRSDGGKIVLYASFHHMNENGFYDGWTEHTITVRPDWEGVKLVISGRNRNDIKEYLYQEYDYALGRVLRRTAEGYELVRE